MVGRRRYLPWLMGTVLFAGAAVSGGCSQTVPQASNPEVVEAATLC